MNLMLGRYAAVDHAAAMESYERPRLAKQISKMKEGVLLLAEKLRSLVAFCGCMHDAAPAGAVRRLPPHTKLVNLHPESAVGSEHPCIRRSLSQMWFGKPFSNYAVMRRVTVETIQAIKAPIYRRCQPHLSLAHCPPAAPRYMTL